MSLASFARVDSVAGAALLPNPPSRLRKDLAACTGDGAAFSLMVGMGETYLAAFALAAGMGEVFAGLISTLPLLAGAMLQLASPWAVRHLKSHRTWVVLCASVQALSLAPLAVAALAGRVSAGAVFLCAAVYWGAGLATGPAWNTWITTIVPQQIRARYFARRTRITQACVLTGFLIGGVSLQYGAVSDQRMLVFALLFAAAVAFRLISAGCLRMQSEPAPMMPGYRDVSLRELARRVCSGEDRLLMYFLGVQLAANIASPFFTPYMLGQLKFSYLHYVGLLAASFLAKIAVLPACGRVAQKRGPRTLLLLGGIGIVPLAGLWIFTDSFLLLFGLQLLAGACWAAYELAVFLLFFETIGESERTSLLTKYNVGHALATVIGSLLGGMLLSGLGAGRYAYLVVFGLSSIARFGCLFLMQQAPRTYGVPVMLATRTLAVRPSAGSIDRPVISSMTETEQVLTSSDDAPHAPAPKSRAPVPYVRTRRTQPATT